MKDRVIITNKFYIDIDGGIISPKNLQGNFEVNYNDYILVKIFTPSPELYYVEIDTDYDMPAPDGVEIKIVDFETGSTWVVWKKENGKWTQIVKEDTTEVIQELLEKLHDYYNEFDSGDFPSWLEEFSPINRRWVKEVDNG